MPDKPDKSANFWQELKRRKVIQVILVYATVSVGIIELVNNVFEPLRLPPWTPTLVIVILAIGFPIAIIFGWIFDITSKGIKKTESIETENVEEELPSTVDKPSIPEKSIIVLPFENISSDLEQEYFSDGLTEEIITDLSHIKDLLVISRSAAMTFKGTKSTVKEIAKKVNVQYVLEGSVRKAGNDLRITAQLIDGMTDLHLWAKKYNGTLDDVFDIQEKVSRSIVDALSIELSPAEYENLNKRPIKNLQAYEYYIRAKQEINTFTKDGLDRAVNYLQNGLEIIGKNALIYAGLGYAYSQYVNIGIGHEAYMDKAEEYANMALELEPDCSDAHFVNGFLNFVFHGNPKKGIQHLKQALEIFPDNTYALFG